MGRPKITALIYDKKGNLLSVGENSYVKTHPLQSSAAVACGSPQRIYLHAEVDAIRRLRVPWHKAHRIVVSRFDAGGRPVVAAPCKICRYVINQTGIKEIHHT